MIARPESSEYATFYADYVRRVPENNVCDFLDSQLCDYLKVFIGVSDDQAGKPRIEGEWTLKEVIGHLCDAERVFGYRALRIARGDKTPLAGFEQDDYVLAAHYNRRRLSDLLGEFAHLRSANVALFRSFTDEDSERLGTASDAAVSARALTYITAGHAARHLELIRDRYGF